MVDVIHDPPERHAQDDPFGGAYLPRRPVEALVAPVVRFLHVQSAGGVVLLACTVVALLLANLPTADAYLGFWETKVGFSAGPFELRHSLRHWINDALMAVFFFVIGLEVKRELVVGELRSVRRAALPLAAAAGGMVVPAAVYLAFQYGTPAARGWGIPMATDIAFVVGCMAVLGPRVPAGLRVLLLSLAIADDIGAILVIAVGYTDEIRTGWLVAGAGGIAAVLAMQRLGVRSIAAYAVLGTAVWLAFHESGVHATIAGVLIGLLTPARPYLEETKAAELLERAGVAFRSGWESLPHRAEKLRRFRRATRETISPLEYLEYVLHPWVAFVIMPVFALANAGVPIAPADLASGTALAVAAGLLIGKPAGVLLFAWLAVAARVAELPQGVGWRQVAGGGLLSGIGFTMAMFIAGLALDDPLLREAKVGVLAGSALAAAAGMAVLVWAAPRVPASTGTDLPADPLKPA